MVEKRVRIEFIMMGAMAIFFGLLVTFVYPVTAGEAKTYPYDETIINGVEDGGTFPSSILHDDGVVRDFQDDGGGNPTIKLWYTFNLDDSYDKHRVVLEGIAYDGGGGAEVVPKFRVLPSSNWVEIDMVDTPTADNLEVYTLDFIIQQSPTVLEIYGVDPAVNWDIRFDYIHILSWGGGPDPPIIDPPEPPPADDQNETLMDNGSQRGLIILGPVLIGFGLCTVTFGMGSPIPGSVVIGLISAGALLVLVNLPEYTMGVLI